MKDINLEIQEAINAADDALLYLKEAEKFAKSAGNWGMFDILGGGFFATMIKREKMEDVEKNISKAQKAIEVLNLELKDLETIIDVNIETGDFLTFADYFFDGFIADFMVQEKINNAIKQIENAILNIEELKISLESMLRDRI
ncbi:MAG: hypothetical protein GX666_01470 [Tissierellia bacterium]|nr:hypothetical protein [Tissierellia bacterium]